MKLKLNMKEELRKEKLRLKNIEIINKLKIKHPFPKTKPNVEHIDHGWMQYGNKRLVDKYVPKATVILELGVWLGTSVKYEINTNPNVTVIAVDLWDDGGKTIQNSIKTDSNIDQLVVKASSDLYNYFLTNVWDYKDNIIPIKMDGRKALKYLHDLDLEIDLIYLDMDHEYKAVYKDLWEIFNYFPGVPIIGDDILYHSGVGYAVKQFIDDMHDMNDFYYKVEVDQNAYLLYESGDVPPSVSSNLPHSLHFEGIYGDNKSRHPLKIISCFKNTDIGIKQAFTWFTLMKEKLRVLKKSLDEYPNSNFTVNNTDIIILISNDNRGKLFNIGFDICNDENCNYIFHEPNILPDEDLIEEYYLTTT